MVLVNILIAKQREIRTILRNIVNIQRTSCSGVEFNLFLRKGIADSVDLLCLKKIT